MRIYRTLMAISLVALVTVTSLVGCRRDKTPAPQQKEELRQKLIKNDERMRREG